MFMDHTAIDLRESSGMGGRLATALPQCKYTGAEAQPESCTDSPRR